MFDGTLCKVENIKINDLVMGWDSLPRQVLSVTKGYGRLYKVNQTSANEYIVNEDHILSLKKSKSCFKDKCIMPSGNYRRPNGRYPNDPEIVNISVKEYLKKSKRWKEHFRGYRAGLIIFPFKKITVDPYLLGLWLGDGSKHTLEITSADNEITEWLQKYCNENYARLSSYSKIGNKAKNYRICKGGGFGKINSIWQEFKKLNIVNNKHIPQHYISNSKEIRLKLLAGLIDTDGTYSAHGYSITSANEILAKDIKRLADTLGYRTSIKKKKTKCKNFIGVAWKISINGNVWEIPCLIERKKYKYNGILPNKDKTLSYLKLEQYDVGEYFGFMIDEDNLFCLADGTVTHNSWTVADFLVVKGYQRKCRILNTREIQNTIKDSVHKLLSDTIERLGLSAFYQIKLDSIVGKNGTEFIFKGLRRDPQDIKSMEGINYAWCEEAHSISRKSLETLIPTIRKENSQIIFTYNPTDKDDPVHKDYTLSDRPDVLRIKCNFTDNPFFPNVLWEQMDWDRSHDTDKYYHIWEGECVKHSEAQVFYGKWFIDDFERYEIKDNVEELVFPPKNTFFYFGSDFGYGVDPATLNRCFVLDNNLYIDYEFHGLKTDIDKLPACYETIPGSKDFPITGDSSRPDTINYIRQRGFPKIKSSIKGKGSVEDGIAFLRSFNKIIIHPRCKHTIDEFRLYSYITDPKTGQISNKLEDKHNHHCFIGDTLVLTNKGYKKIKNIKINDLVLTRSGYNKVLKIFNNGRKQVNNFKIINKSLTSTDTHKIITPNKKIDIKNVSKNDIIYVWNEFLCKQIKTKNMKRSYLMASLIAGIQIVRDDLTEFILNVLQKMGLNICMSLNTKNIKEIFQKDVASIIKIIILSIMKLIIWIVCPAVFIFPITIRFIVGIIKAKLKNIYQRFVILHLNGIKAKKVERGTKNMQGNVLNMKRKHTNVIFAINPLLRLRELAINFVRMLANRPIVGKWDSITLIKFVHFVIKNFIPINIQNKKHVHEDVQTVYDLMIENQHEYFANGILVSNCDNLRYALEDLMRNRKVQATKSLAR